MQCRKVSKSHLPPDAQHPLHQWKEPAISVRHNQLAHWPIDIGSGTYCEDVNKIDKSVEQWRGQSVVDGIRGGKGSGEEKDVLVIVQSLDFEGYGA